MESGHTTFRTRQTPAGTVTQVVLSEQRITERRALQVNARLLAQEGNIVIPARTVDISANGLSLLVDRSLQQGDVWEIAFDLPMEGVFHPIAAVAEVAHGIVAASGVRVGFRFKRLNMASMIAISRFVR
jgi:hypothetical protein